MEVRAVQVMLFVALGACKSDPKPTAPAPSCSAEVVTDRGSFSATANAEGEEARGAVRKRALERACAKSCGGAKDKADACRSRCMVDIDAAKVGARVKCRAFPEGDKGATSG